MNDDYKAVDGILPQMMCFCAITYTLNRIGRHDWLMSFFLLVFLPRVLLKKQCLFDGKRKLDYDKILYLFLANVPLVLALQYIDHDAKSS